MSNIKFDIDLIINAANSAKTIDDIKKSLNDLRNASRGLDTTSDSFNKISRSVVELEGRLKAIPTNLRNATEATKNASNATGAYSNALIDISRVLQDLPYGIRGVANNLNPLVESFGRASQAAGGFKGALSGIMSTLMTPAGAAGLGIAAIGSAWVMFGDNIDLTGEKIRKAIEGLKIANKDASNEIKSTTFDLKIHSLEFEKLGLTPPKSQQEYDRQIKYFNETKKLNLERVKVIKEIGEAAKEAGPLVEKYWEGEKRFFNLGEISESERQNVKDYLKQRAGESPTVTKTFSALTKRERELARYRELLSEIKGKDILAIQKFNDLRLRKGAGMGGLYDRYQEGTISPELQKSQKKVESLLAQERTRPLTDSELFFVYNNGSIFQNQQLLANGEYRLQKLKQIRDLQLSLDAKSQELLRAQSTRRIAGMYNQEAIERDKAKTVYNVGLLKTSTDLARGTILPEEKAALDNILGTEFSASIIAIDKVVRDTNNKLSLSTRDINETIRQLRTNLFIENRVDMQNNLDDISSFSQKELDLVKDTENELIRVARFGQKEIENIRARSELKREEIYQKNYNKIFGELDNFHKRELSLIDNNSRTALELKSQQLNEEEDLLKKSYEKKLITTIQYENALNLLKINRELNERALVQNQINSIRNVVNLESGLRSSQYSAQDINRDLIRSDMDIMLQLAGIRVDMFSDKLGSGSSIDPYIKESISNYADSIVSIRKAADLEALNKLRDLDILSVVNSGKSDEEKQKELDNIDLKFKAESLNIENRYEQQKTNIIREQSNIRIGIAQLEADARMSITQRYLGGAEFVSNTLNLLSDVTSDWAIASLVIEKALRSAQLVTAMIDSNAKVSLAAAPAYMAAAAKGPAGIPEFINITKSVNALKLSNKINTGFSIASIIAETIKGISDIKSRNFGGGSSSSAAGASSVSPAPIQFSGPQFFGVGAQNIANPRDFATNRLSVYERDISEAQNRVKVILNRSRVG